MHDISKDFPILEKQMYLDSAATTQKPVQVIEAEKHFYLHTYANIHRGIYSLSTRASSLYADARATIGRFLGCATEEIIFTRNATESINLLSYTLPKISSRKHILLTEMEHHANHVPWLRLKEQGYTISFIKMKDDFTLDYEDAAQKVTEDTLLVGCAHISNALGTVHDVARLADIAHAQGAYMLIDGAQSASRMPVDLKRLGCDFFACSGHKLYGPTGIGVLYGTKELLAKLPPFLSGGDMIAEVDYETASWQAPPEKFEAGTPHIAGAIGLGAAIKYLQQIGMDAVWKHEQELRAYAYAQLQAIEGITLYAPHKGAGILSCNLEGLHPHDVSALLDEENICVRAGHHCAMPLMSRLGVQGTVRISFGIYTTKKDIDICSNAIKKLAKLAAHRKKEQQ